MNLIDGAWGPCWIVDFPMFERTEKEILAPCTIPFTAAQEELDCVLSNPDLALSKAYDLVLNGFEIGGGLSG